MWQNFVGGAIFLTLSVLIRMVFYGFATNIDCVVTGQWFIYLKYANHYRKARRGGKDVLDFWN